MKLDIEAKMHKQSSLLYWYPKIKDIVATPKTVIVPYPFGKGGQIEFLERGDLRGYTETVANSNPFGYPVFIRTDQTSAKHEWRDTCFVDSKETLGRHIGRLMESDYLILDFTPGGASSALVLREFLKLKAYFTAYAGMPVAKEFRFFARNGHIECVHPYWPHTALLEGEPSEPYWRNFLQEFESGSEKANALVECASKEFPELWSFDICFTEDNRIYLTDMARGEISAHWKHGTTDGGQREDIEKGTDTD